MCGIIKIGSTTNDDNKKGINITINNKFIFVIFKLLKIMPIKPKLKLKVFINKLISNKIKKLNIKGKRAIPKFIILDNKLTSFCFSSTFFFH